METGSQSGEIKGFYGVLRARNKERMIRFYLIHNRYSWEDIDVTIKLIWAPLSSRHLCSDPSVKTLTRPNTSLNDQESGAFDPSIVFTLIPEFLQWYPTQAEQELSWESIWRPTKIQEHSKTNVSFYFVMCLVIQHLESDIHRGILAGGIHNCRLQKKFWSKLQDWTGWTGQHPFHSISSFSKESRTYATFPQWKNELKTRYE